MTPEQQDRYVSGFAAMVGEKLDAWRARDAGFHERWDLAQRWHDAAEALAHLRTLPRPAG